MERKALNIKMFSTKDCQDIIDEIKDEYIRGGHEICSDESYERFSQRLKREFEKFDFISNSLIAPETYAMHLVQKGTRFGLFCGYNISIEWPIKFLQINQQGENGGLMALDDNLKWGIPNKTTGWNNRTTILPFEFDDINVCTGDFFPVKQQGKWGLYSYINWKMVIDPQYDDARSVCEGLWAVSKDGKWGFVDIFNDVIIPFEYDSVSNFINGYAHAVKSVGMNNNHNFILDHNGKETSFRHEKLLEDQYRGGIKVKTSYVGDVEYYYAVGPDNEILIPKNKYRYLGDYSEGLFKASINGAIGYIDINENIVIPSIYQSGTLFQWGLVCVKLNHEKYSWDWIIINYKNKQVFPYMLCNSKVEFEKGRFFVRGLIGFGDIGDRFKNSYIDLNDLINYKQGKNMSYLIRTDEETERTRQRRIKAYRNQAPPEWTSEDTWDAMTDGMYGDYPGGDVDYEVLGF